MTAVAKELEEAAAATARQVQAAQEEGRMLRQKAEAAIVAKEMALNHAAEADREPKQPAKRALGPSTDAAVRVQGNGRLCAAGTHRCVATLLHI